MLDVCGCRSKKRIILHEFELLLMKFVEELKLQSGTLPSSQKPIFTIHANA